MHKSYESCSNKNSIEANDCDTSRLTTASFSKLVKKTFKPTAMTVYLRYFKPTDLNLTKSLQETPDVNGNRRNLCWMRVMQEQEFYRS